MLNKRIIPCLEIAHGRLVQEARLAVLGDPGDPLEAAEALDAQGADELALSDVSGSKLDRDIFRELVTLISERVFVTLTTGGGVTDIDGVVGLIEAGADKVVIDAAEHRAAAVVREAAAMFGSQCIVARIEVRRAARPGSLRWEICGPDGFGRAGSGPVEWASLLQQAGAGEIVLTSMDRNQARDGYDLALTRSIAERVAIPVVASGAVGTVDHIRLGLAAGGASAALAIGNLPFNDHTIGHCKQYLRRHGVPVRI